MSRWVWIVLATASLAPMVARADEANDKAVIHRYIKRNLAEITACYERQLHDHPKLAGTVEAHFTIGTDGRVTQSHAEGVHPDVSTCVAEVIQRIEFPKPKGGGTVTVNYPFIFHTNGDAKPAQ